MWDHRLYPPEDADLPVTLAQRLRQRLRPQSDPPDEGGFHR
jgi:hypothetical protein